MLFSKFATATRIITTTTTTTTTTKNCASFSSSIRRRRRLILTNGAQSSSSSSLPSRLKLTAPTTTCSWLSSLENNKFALTQCLLPPGRSFLQQLDHTSKSDRDDYKKSNDDDECRKAKRLNVNFSKLLLSLALFVPIVHAKHNSENADDGAENKPRKKFNFIADVVEVIIPSIVQISIKTATPYGQMDAASGSGFIVSHDGIILTNAHVVRNHIKDINVKLNDGRSFSGRVVKIDRSADLAIIKIDCKDLKPVRLGDSSQVRTGEFVIALGSPLSLNNTVTSGVVSNPNRDGTELGLTNKLTYLQTDTIVTHGNSGGPLINLDGEVVGVNTMTAAPGISFAIPSKYASEFLNTNIDSIASKYRYLGMKMISITPQIFYLFNTQPNSDIRVPDRNGCLVVDVAPKSPSEKAGLKRGDVIVSANNQTVAKNSDLFDILRQTPELKLIIVRDNKEIKMVVKADEKEG